MSASNQEHDFRFYHGIVESRSSAELYISFKLHCTLILHQFLFIPISFQTSPESIDVMRRSSPSSLSGSGHPQSYLTHLLAHFTNCRCNVSALHILHDFQCKVTCIRIRRFWWTNIVSIDGKYQNEGHRYDGCYEKA